VTAPSAGESSPLEAPCPPAVSAAEVRLSAEPAEAYRAVRELTETLCAPLQTEDYVVQSMPDVSPTKWHLAHTTWFFETFVLAEARRDYVAVDPQYGYLFNSYYNAVGERHARPQRGLLSRPTVREVRAYRAAIDERMGRLLESGALSERLRAVVEVGLHHEQQHQELMLMDIKHVFACNPLKPAYRAAAPAPARAPALRWVGCDGGLVEVGHAGGSFAFDNEGPRHRVYLEPFELGSRLVTNGEYLAFVDDGGYEQPEHWLADGWDAIRTQGWRAPLYWERRDGAWWVYTLGGMRPVDPGEPVCHVSFYEADAFARWAGARLPTEAEWEVAASRAPVRGNFVECGTYHPQAAGEAAEGSGLRQLWGDVWEWTASPYVAYPGFAPLEGALGEYNGKFMSGTVVLRGGCCATSITHIRATYRNFFAPSSRWPFGGLRLARDARRG
jgi:ergothioneine biosynthesis protein EgtB